MYRQEPVTRQHSESLEQSSLTERKQPKRSSERPERMATFPLTMASQRRTTPERAKTMKKINITELVKTERTLHDLEKAISNCTRAMMEYEQRGETEKAVYQYYAKNQKKAIEHRDALLSESSEISKKVYSAIREAEGRATERTLTLSIILDNLIIVENRLDVSKKALNGTKVFADPHAQKFPRAYKYVPMSTHFSAEFENGKWYLLSVDRERCTEGDGLRLILSDSCRSALIDRFSSLPSVTC